MSRRSLLAVLSAMLSAVAALSLAGCCGRGGGGGVATRPPYPTDPDPCAAYCLVWVPQTYREVPTLVECKPSCTDCKSVWAKQINFCETCTPSHYEPRCRPDVCREYGVVEVTPGYTDWESVECCPAPGVCGKPCCYRPVKRPPTYKVCKKTETEQGIEYCAYTPPEYEVYRYDTLVGMCAPVHSPAEYKVAYKQELFENGHYAWIKRDCGCAPARTEPPKCVCTPQPVAGCGSCGVVQQPASCAPRALPRKGSFGHAPAAD